MSEKPEEPNFDALEEELDFSFLDEEAVQMHELFNSLTKAGFKERQALTLVAMIVNETTNYVTLQELQHLDSENTDEEDTEGDYPADGQ
jgi:hypothetical protein